ncbi:MAG: hypothetical protein K0U98_12810 [Deltaproteobacteria bacterium]|nr:hypothetical protein [Deltaproteobacteria bacterium]
MKKDLWKVIFLSLLVGFSPLAAEAGTLGSSLLDESGHLYRVTAGAYGELFVGSTELPAETSVLVLEVQTPGEDVERFLVPGTENQAVESSPSLLFEDASRTLFVLWHSARPASSTLVLGSFREGQWLDVVDVHNSGEVDPGSSRFSVTREVYTADSADEAPSSVRRTIVHLVWAEEETSASPSGAVSYAPMIFEEGVFLGWNPVVNLNSLAPHSESPGSPSEIIAGPPTVQSGGDSRTVMVGFPDPQTGRLVTVEIRPITMELGLLAYQASLFIKESGENGPALGGLSSLAGGVGNTIIDIGFSFHLSVKAYLASIAEASVLEIANSSNGPGISLDFLAGGVGNSIIDIGSRVFGGDGMQREFEDSRLTLLRVPYESPEGQEPLPIYAQSRPAHIIRLYAVADRLAPQTGNQGLTFLSSESGDHGLVCWETADGQLRYRETIEGEEGWTEVQSLTIDENLTLERAHEILRERARRR